MFTYRRNSISTISLTLIVTPFQDVRRLFVHPLNRRGVGFFFRHKLAILLSHKEIVVERFSYL